MSKANAYERFIRTPKNRAISLLIRLPRLGPHVQRWYRRANRATYRLSRGRFGGRFGTAEVILLTTTGARSGLARTAPLGAVRRGDDWLIVAVNGGRDNHPAWVYNLRAASKAIVETPGQPPRTMIAREVGRGDPEWSVLYPLFADAYEPYADYPTRTTRPIPIFALTIEADVAKGRG